MQIYFYIILYFEFIYMMINVQWKIKHKIFSTLLNVLFSEKRLLPTLPLHLIRKCPDYLCFLRFVNIWLLHTQGWSFVRLFHLSITQSKSYILQTIHILNTWLPRIWNLPNNFEVFETNKHIEHSDKLLTKSLNITVFRAIYIIFVGNTCYTYKRRDPHSSLSLVSTCLSCVWIN